jgi:hypothetical protein
MSVMTSSKRRFGLVEESGQIQIALFQQPLAQDLRAALDPSRTFKKAKCLLTKV